LRALFGGGTPREAAHAAYAFLSVIQLAEASTFVLLAAYHASTVALIVAITLEAN
jgi:hypothetical protein